MSGRAADLIAKAVRTNAGRDAKDRASGFASPDQVPTDLRLQTVMSALECGMQMADWDAVAEGFVMLRDLHETLRKDAA